MKAKAHLRLRTRLLRGVVLGFAVAAAVVPAAQARHDEGNGPAVQQSTYVPGVTDFPKAAASTQPLVIPYLSHGYGLTQSPSTGTIRADGPDGAVSRTPVVLVSSPAVDNGFDWQPFGIGAAGGLALALIAAASALGVRRRHSGMALS